MRRTFPRPQPGQIPTTGSSDELLETPPATRPCSSFDGYRSGRRLRIAVYVAAAGAFLVAVKIRPWFIGDPHDGSHHRHRPNYVRSDDTLASAELYWSGGTARLGLSAGGVQRIILPDRAIALAPGCEHAQIKVRVQDGRTVELTTLLGEIVEAPRAAERLPPARPAMAP